MTTPEEDKAWRLIVDHYDETAVRDPQHPAETEPTQAREDSSPDEVEASPALSSSGVVMPAGRLPSPPAGHPCHEGGGLVEDRLRVVVEGGDVVAVGQHQLDEVP